MANSFHGLDLGFDHSQSSSKFGTVDKCSILSAAPFDSDHKCLFTQRQAAEEQLLLPCRWNRMTIISNSIGRSSDNSQSVRMHTEKPTKL